MLPDREAMFKHKKTKRLRIVATDDDTEMHFIRLRTTRCGCVARRSMAMQRLCRPIF